VPAVDIRKTAIERNPFLGLFLRASDSVLLAPPNLPQKVREAAEATLRVNTTRLLVHQSNLLGVYCCLNSNGVLLPEFAEDAEVRLLKGLGLNVVRLDSRWGAVGNNVLANDRAALVNPDLPADQAQQVADALGVEVEQAPVSGLKTVGAVNVVTNKGLLAYNHTTEVELKRLESLFKVKGSVGSANMGVPFVGICAVANSRGALLGELSSGFEVQRAYQALSGE
jgi:translation initiation factor 6